MDMNVIKNNQAWIDETFAKVEKKLSKTAIKSRDKLPYTTVDGVHDNCQETRPCWWTNGFWGGMMWLMYLATNNEEFKLTAQRSEELLDLGMEKYEGLHHDVGFMYHLTAGASYRITGDRKSYLRNMYAACTLASRYNIDGKFISAWNGEMHEGWSIIDCLMNIPLLYWASKEQKVDRFKRIAMSHCDMAVRDHIREDGSVNHIVEHKIDSDEVVRVYGGQGYEDASCWSRGLAWAVYGTVLSYIHTGKKEYLDAAIKTANYFIANAAATDYKTLVDFKSPLEPVLYDSTAGVCTACGLLELAKFVSPTEAQMYTEAAIKLLKATDEHFCDYTEEQDALVLMGTERYPHNENEAKGVHIPIVYGDFFFVEALCKLKGVDFLIW